jgi:hypothetical protein
MTSATTARPKRTWWQFAGYLAKRATLMELRGYQSIYRFMFRRPKVSAGAEGFSYHRPILALMIVFIVVSAVEVVVVDWIASRWAYIRIPVLIISIWGVVWMLDLLFGVLVRPHAVGPTVSGCATAAKSTSRSPGTTSIPPPAGSKPYRTNNPR